MGRFFNFGNRSKTQYEPDLQELYERDLGGLGASLGLKLVKATRAEGPQLRGRIGAHTVRVRTSRLDACRIEAKFDSGLTGFSVLPKSSNVNSDKQDVLTGDGAFDADFRTLISAKVDSDAVLTYLTAQRREAIHALGRSFERIKVKPDELRVHMAEYPPVDALREAIDHSVRAAASLHAVSSS